MKTNFAFERIQHVSQTPSVFAQSFCPWKIGATNRGFFEIQFIFDYSN
jgi:hypothetical protein